MTPSPLSQAFFLPLTPGQRFCVYHPAQAERPRGLVVHVHPFGEEMNKTRRMSALQARAMANAGYSVLQFDLLGCGDSSADFGDAGWQSWVDDVVGACLWIQKQASAPLWLWGMRAGCLLATQAARQLAQPCNFLFWQPSVSGKPLLQQFLRLKAAAEMLEGGAKGVVEAMRQDLAAGRPVEVAGYRLAPTLAQGLERAQLLPPELTGTLAWLEVSSREDAELAPVSGKALEQWRQAGFVTHGRVVEGPSFWQSTEVEEAPLLLEASLAAMVAGAGQ